MDEIVKVWDLTETEVESVTSLEPDERYERFLADARPELRERA